VDDRYAALEQTLSPSGLLGYLNFSDGRPDPRWQKQLNDAYAFLAERGPAPWQALLDWLSDALNRLQAAGAAAFRDVTQAARVLALATRTLPAYRRHHGDLLAHLSDADLFGPFFLARVFEAVLREGAERADAEVDGVLARLNDFVGHRPIAILETRPQVEPYEHERVRPLPLYLRGAGVAWGRYRDVLTRALEILPATNPGLLAEAHFDLDLLDELALDVRAYDHGHPVNRRPNYVFGEWDPHHLDNQGRHRRYVARQVAFDALLTRIRENENAEPASRLDPDELLTEAAAVLAGTVLMASGVSGTSPTAHDSTTTLATLLPPIARVRDAFYEQLLGRMGGAHAERLRREQATTRQPFGAARQHLNAYLARHRATQLQQRSLSLLLARMGFPEASRTEARRIPAVSLRLLSEIHGRLASGQVETDQGRLRDAAARLPEVEDLLHRGIACGAFADPWNVLGFQGLFPLSPAREDSVRDLRLDELVQAVELTFNLYGRLLSEAAAAGEADVVRTLEDGQEGLAHWWDQYATYEVSDVRRVHGGEAASSARQVATALARWRERGEAAADLAFWRGHLEGFRAPRAFALVADTLLRKGDFRAALALLVSWLGRADQVPLEDGLWSFHNLALRWMLSLTRTPEDGPAGPPLPADRPGLVVRFFDYVEANAEEYWHVPTLDLVRPAEDEPEEEDLYGAAYDDVTYQDSTADGNEGAVDDGGPPVGEYDLEQEGERLDRRLRFLSTLARLYQIAARFLLADAGAAEHLATLQGWRAAARDKRQQLLALLDAVHAHPVPEPTGEYDSLVEYDRRRVLKEQLLSAAIGTCLDTSLAVSALQGAVASASSPGGPVTLDPPSAATPAWEEPALRLEQALFRGDAAAARLALPAFVEEFRSEPLLLTPLSEGGTPRQVLRVRLVRAVLRALLANLPRLGLLRETFELLRTARAMEQAQPAGGRRETEFNQFFQVAYQAVTENVIDSVAAWGSERGDDSELVRVLERLTAPFLGLWIEHSQSLRLSVLETVRGEAEWQMVQGFVQQYGRDLFDARFMTLANLRGILHRGVGAWLDSLRDDPDPLHPVKLLDDLDRGVRREDAVRRLEVVLSAVVESYEEYKDYNTTTTQSDYGENVYVLLDFLRLKALYDRQAWLFRPRVLAHEMLARHGRTQAALLWEASLTQATRHLARQLTEQLARLERARGARLGTVSDRLNERFVKPLALDRLCALIEPSMREAQAGTPGPAFTQLQEELRAHTATPTGVGLDVPHWLRRLEAEVQRVQATQTTVAVLAENFFRVPRQPLSFEELQRQLREWDPPALPP
jgi:hypothetical protein